MGSWDCYCAICGGPFGGADVSRKPRTARFRRKMAKTIAKCQERGVPDDEDVSSASEDEDGEEDDNESLDKWDEDHTYDPEVITEEEATWTRTLHVLGFNPGATGVSK